MKFSILHFIFLVLIISCIQDKSSLGPMDIKAELQEIHPLPDSTLHIIDFNRVIIKNNGKIEMVNIQNPDQSEIIYELVIPTGKRYKTIKNERFVIFESREDTHTELIADLTTGDVFELTVSENYPAICSINEAYYSMLYIIQSYRPELHGYLSKLFYRTLNWGAPIFIADSVSWAEWSPDGNWILVTRFSYKEGNYSRWHEDILNFSGDEIPLFDESIAPVSSIWTNDGNYALFKSNPGGRITIMKFDWSGEKPEFKFIASGDHYYDPVLWSPDDRYFIHTKENSDGHVVFGIDIWLADRTLTFNKAIIKHENVQELPIVWTSENGLVTRGPGGLLSYEIDF
jgi:WD40 repeat protein